MKLEIDLDDYSNFCKVYITSLKLLPKIQGLYILCNDTKGIIYIGKSINIYSRIKNHPVLKSHEVSYILYKEVQDFDLLLNLEKLYIFNHFKEFNNSQTIGMSKNKKWRIELENIKLCGIEAALADRRKEVRAICKKLGYTKILNNTYKKQLNKASK